MLKLLFLIPAALLAANSFSQVINNPESVEYDAASNRYLVSNRATPISIQSLVPGQAPSLFTSSVSSPAGLEILNGKLWVCDGGSLKSFDLSSGSLVDNIAIGATFLNGITSNGSDILYISDFSAKKIYSVNTSNLVYTEIVTNTVSTPNGMWYDGDNNRVLFVNWGTNAPIKAVDLSNNSVSTAATTSLGNCDGIARDAAGNYFVSAWTQGAVYRFDSNLSNPVAVVTGLTQPADIYYNTLNDTLAVPQTSADLITFHNFGTASSEESNEDQLHWAIFPNPANTLLSVAINNVLVAGNTIRMYNLSGQLIMERTIGVELNESAVININTAELSEGIYILELNGEQGSFRRSVQIRH